MMGSRHNAELVVVCVVCFVIMGHNGVVGTKKWRMEDKCNAEMSMILESAYQAQLEFSTSRSFDLQSTYDLSDDTSVCDSRIEAWYNKPQIMFYFDHLELDCDNGYLDFFDGYKSKYDDDTSVPISVELTRLCGDSKPSGVYTTQTRNLRIRYTTLKPAVQENVFKIITTAYKDGTCPTYDYECDNGRCIDDDVSCTEHNSCGDNSGCGSKLSTYTILRIAGACVSVVIFVIILVLCVRRHRRRRREQNAACPPVVQYAPNQTQQVFMPTQAGTDMKGQFAYGAPPPGQSPYYTPPPGQPTGYAPPPGQPTGYAPPPGQPTGYAPPPGQPTGYAPPPEQSYAVPPPTYSGLYPTGGPEDHEESKQGLMSTYPPKQ